MRDDVVFVLYQPQDVVNIGGTVRAMSNFGLGRLRLVDPVPYDLRDLAGIAHQGGTVIAGITEYPTLDAALADCGLVVATTARPRRTRRPRQTPRTAAPDILAMATPEAPVAVLFGREDSGLPNSALDAAHRLITIPTAPANRSLNLAQAVLVVAYELWLAAQPGAGPPRPPRAPAPAHGAAREAMFAALETLLATRGGVPAARLAYDLAILRAVLLRAVPRPDEAARLTHLFRRLAADPEAPGAPPPDAPNRA